ncbi:hypothetical protein J2S58_001266 [Nakamurella flavida]|nr:hypothetical protein [Nakamurella flavida]
MAHRAGVDGVQRCSRTGCDRPGTAVLVYDHVRSTAFIGPLIPGPSAGPPASHSYRLCSGHAARPVVPADRVVVHLE